MAKRSKLKLGRSVSTYRIPTWTTPLVILLFTTALVPNTSLLSHLASVGVGYMCTISLRLFLGSENIENKLTRLRLDGLGYLKILAPPEKVLRWIEGKLNLLGRLPHYVSIDQKTYGRYGVLPTTSNPSLSGAGEGAVPMTYLGSGQRLGP